MHVFLSTLCAIAMGMSISKAEIAGDFGGSGGRMEWFREAKFGMYVHWGIYAVAAGKHEGREVPDLGEHIMRVGRVAGIAAGNHPERQARERIHRGLCDSGAIRAGGKTGAGLGGVPDNE